MLPKWGGFTWLRRRTRTDIVSVCQVGKAEKGVPTQFPPLKLGALMRSAIFPSDLVRGFWLAWCPCAKPKERVGHFGGSHSHFETTPVRTRAPPSPRPVPLRCVSRRRRRAVAWAKPEVAWCCRRALSRGMGINSVVQWHPFSLFVLRLPSKNGLPQKGFLFFQGH